MASSSGRALEVPEQRGGMEPSSARPWQFDLPTLAEMQEGGWVDKVRDWELFWARHKVWQNFTQYKARKNAKPRREHEEWWGLHDPVAVQKVCIPIISARNAPAAIYGVSQCCSVHSMHAS